MFNGYRDFAKLCNCAKSTFPQNVLYNFQIIDRVTQSNNSNQCQITFRLGEMAERTSNSVSDFFRDLLYRLSLACLPCFELLTIICPGLMSKKRRDKSSDQDLDDAEEGNSKKTSKKTKNAKKGRRKGEKGSLLDNDSCASSTTNLDDLEEEDLDDDHVKNGGGRKHRNKNVGDTCSLSF